MLQTMSKRITSEKVACWLRYSGDVAALDQKAGPRERVLFENRDDWMLIDLILQSLEIAREQEHSEHFQNRINTQLELLADLR